MSSELAVYGADTSNQQAGGNSFFDRATMFTGASVVSGLASIYNTFVDYGNMAGMNADMIDVGRVLETYDNQWYQYYKENKEMTDITGFVAGSLIPGTLAIKGLKAVQAGRAGGAIGRAVSGPLNVFNAQRDKYLAKGLQEIASEGGSAFAYVNSNKLAAMGWGVAENVLQNAAFEAGVLLTMNNSPILADRGSKEILSDVMFGAFVGGGIGGALDAVATQRIFKDAVRQLGSKQRGYDTASYFNRDGSSIYSGVGIGDEAFGFVDSILALPSKVAEGDNLIRVANRFSGKEIELDITKQLQSSLNKTQRDLADQVLITLNKLGTKDTPEVGQEFGNFIFKTIKDNQAAGASPADIKQAVGSYLLGLKNVRTIVDDVTLNSVAREDYFYIKSTLEMGKLAENGNNLEALTDLATSRTPFKNNATAKPYKVVGDPAAAKTTLTATSFNEAWEQGYDVAMVGNKIRINPKSEIYQQVPDPVLVPRRYLNTRTGGVSDEITATWADMLPAGEKAEKNILKDGVRSGKEFTAVADDVEASTAYTATARHAWASQLTESAFANATISSRDISKLERLRSSGWDLQTLNVSIEVNGVVKPAMSVDIDQLLLQTKLDKLQEFFTSAEAAGVKADIRELGYIINSSEEWITKALAEGFQPNQGLKDGMSRELVEYLRRENFVATWESPRSLVGVGNVDAKLLEETQAAAMSHGSTYKDTFVTGELGFTQRIQLSEKINNDAFYAVLGKEVASQFLELDAKNVTKMANELGVGAGALSFSNADYGDIAKLWAQYTGKLTHQLIQAVSSANLEKLQPFFTAIREDKQAGAELGVIVNMLRRSSDKFVLTLDSTGKQSLVVRELTAIDKASGQRYVVGSRLDEYAIANPGKKAVFNIESDKVVAFLDQWKTINAERIGKKTVLMNARGATIGWDPDTIYAPPIDTQRYPYFAFVKIRDGHVASTSDVAMITARSPEELSKLTREVPSDTYEVFFKKDTEQYYKVKQMYDAQMSLNEPKVDSMLRKQGKLGDLFYEVRPESVVEDFIRYSQQADSTLVRQAVDTKYAQLITELNALGKQYTEVATSQMTGLSKAYDKTVINPFGDYVRTALDISKRSSFPLVSQLNEFVDSLGTAAYRSLVVNTEKAKAGLISWQEAEQIAGKYGIGGVYNADNVETAFALANRPSDRNLIRETVSKANSFLSIAGLQLDFANSLVNVISMPIMLGAELASLKSLAESNPEAIGALQHLTTLSPDGKIAVPSYTKIIADAIKNVVGPGGKELVESYRATGDVKSVVTSFHDLLDDLAVNPKIAPAQWSKLVDNAVEKGGKWTGNDFAEDFTRAVSANVMDQLTAPLIAAKLLSPQEAAAYRSVFVNRVNGNYIASQRPVFFQGTVGGAISLFQTYVFNVMQQLTRHIENRDTRALFTMGGLQGAIYGFNGLPMFEAINTHLIGNASINDGHKDIYSYVNEAAGKTAGNWLMYGTASAFPLFGDKAPALYTRGDINPRHITVLPVSPMDIPAVSVSMRIAQNIFDVGGKISNGGALGASLLEGLEHNGVSRPLAGFAQIAQGYTTTSKGSLISSSNEFDGVVMGTRMLGAKPMDEAVMLNTMYRLQAYKAADLNRLSKLGEVVKTKLRANQSPTAEEMQDFMKSYASAGGNLQNYGSALQRWSRDANMSVVNQMKTFHQSSYAQRLSEIMSGTTLDDFTNMQAAVTPPIQP